MKRGRHGLQFMQPSSAHDCCIRGWHVYHQIFSLLPDWSRVNCHCDPAHWPNAFPRKSYQWSVVGLEINITNSRKPKEFDSLLSIRMKDSESLKSYSLRYWEVYNEVDGCIEEIAIKTFKLGLDPKSELRHNLSRRPAKSMRDLMSQIEQFVQVEDDRARTRAIST